VTSGEYESQGMNDRTIITFFYYKKDSLPLKGQRKTTAGEAKIPMQVELVVGARQHPYLINT